MPNELITPEQFTKDVIRLAERIALENGVDRDELLMDIALSFFLPPELARSSD